ncbi:MAG: co-chaperone GroES [Chloroflexota bacterium]
MATKTAAKITPLGDRVLIKPVPKEEMSKGGIVLPDTTKEKPQEGEVVAVGPGRVTDEGTRVAMDLKKGDRIVYAKYAGTDIKLDDDDYLILRDTDVLARIVR